MEVYICRECKFVYPVTVFKGIPGVESKFVNFSIGEECPRCGTYNELTMSGKYNFDLNGFINKIENYVSTLKSDEISNLHRLSSEVNLLSSASIKEYLENIRKTDPNFYKIIQPQLNGKKVGLIVFIASLIFMYYMLNAKKDFNYLPKINKPNIESIK